MADRVLRATDTNGLLLGDLRPGTRVGEYLIETALPTRGTGHGYEAIHLVLPRRVTIKVIPAAQALPRAVAIDLLREACIVEALDHPGIPRIYECGLLPDRRPWVATEHVDGMSLATRATDLSMRETAALVRDVAEILDHAHARAIVHHNVLPAAVIFPKLARRFPICLVDWSGARTLDSSSPVPMIAGEHTYSAPERLTGASKASASIVDPRSDVYSLGVIARDLIRRTPADAQPPIFQALIARMLSRDPEQRPSAKSVREHAAWLATQIPNDDVPEPIVEETTEQIPLVTFSSDVSPEVSGEIRRPEPD